MKCKKTAVKKDKEETREKCTGGASEISITDQAHLRSALTSKSSSFSETYSKIKTGIKFEMQKEGLKERHMEIKGLGT